MKKQKICTKCGGTKFEIGMGFISKKCTKCGGKGFLGDKVELKKRGRHKKIDTQVDE